MASHQQACLALFTLAQVVYSFPFLPLSSPPFLPILISFALSMVIYLSDLYLSSTNKLGYHGPPLLSPHPLHPHSPSPSPALYLLPRPPCRHHLIPHLTLPPTGFGSWLMRCHVKVSDGVCRGGYLGCRLCVEALYARAGFVCVGELRLCRVVLHCCLLWTQMWQVAWSVTGWWRVCVCLCNLTIHIWDRL